MTIGRLNIVWYWPLSMWSLGFHYGDCCVFYLEAGPLEIMVAPRD